MVRPLRPSGPPQRGGPLRSVLLLLLLLLVGLVAIPAFPDVALARGEQGEVEDGRVDLPAGARLEHDGAGGFRLVRPAEATASGDPEELLSFDLRWLGARMVSPEGSSLAAGAGAERVVADDGASVARPTLPGLEDSLLEVTLRHWPYFHVDDIVFVDAVLRRPDGGAPMGAVALGVRSEHPWQLRRLRQRPHLSVGRAPWAEFDLLQARFQQTDGSRLYVGIVRLDRRRASTPENEAGVVYEAGTPATWPLAVVVARTRSSLEYLAGQALLTYDHAGDALLPEEYWNVPPLCGRCRDPHLEEFRVELRAEDGSLRVETEIRSDERVDHDSPEGLRIDGLPLGPHLGSSGAQGAVYAIPLTSPVAEDLLRSALDGQLDVEVWMDAGLAVVPEHVEVIVDAGTLDALRTVRAEEEVEEELPSYLSPALLTSWPNPFRGETTIEVEVPRTLGEAFELDAALAARLDPDGPPPFGESPSVRVRVYNVGGQLVRTLYEEVRGAGRFSVQWNGNDVQGRPVAAGAYYVNVEMGDWSVTKRVLRLAP